MVESLLNLSIERRAATPTIPTAQFMASHSIGATVKLTDGKGNPWRPPGRRLSRELLTTKSYKTEPAAALREVFSSFTGVFSERSHESRCVFRRRKILNLHPRPSTFTHPYKPDAV